MSYMVVLIVDDIENCPPVLNAWEEAGITGATVLNSTGLGRIRRAGLRDDIPLMPSLSDIFQSSEVHHRTLISVVDDEAMVDRLVAAAQEVIGDLDEPHTGFLFVVPVLKTVGMGRHRLDRSKE